MAKRGNLDILIGKNEKNIMRKMNVSHICSVVELSDKKDKANIQPLAQTEEGNNRAMLIDVPVTLNCRDFISVGGTVVVLFMDRNSSNYNGNSETFPIKDDRTHSVNDGVIVGVLT